MDEIDLNDFTSCIDDEEQTTQIYSAFVEKATLEPQDRELLKAKRGFSDELIGTLKYKSCQASNAAILDDLKQTYTEDQLLEAGLLEIHDGAVKPCLQLITPNILIPYLNKLNQAYYIRPHKFGLKDKGISIYCPVYPDAIANPETLLICESEFKAAAAVQFGYLAIGLPGIHSFAVNNYPRLLNWIKQYPKIKKIVIIFDNEIKNNPKFPNYKPDVLKQWDTQWRAVQLSVKLNRDLFVNRTKVTIGHLPDEWMVEGKIDIDGALAAGKTRDEFKKVVITSKLHPDYTKLLPQDAQIIINKKRMREEFRSPIEKINNCYYSKKPGKGKKKGSDDDDEEEDFVRKRISNFVLEIDRCIEDGDFKIREVTLRGDDGAITTSRKCLPSNVAIIREFSKWIAGCGDFIFSGSQEELNHVFELEFKYYDGRTIIRPHGIGYLNKQINPVWLLGNCLIKEDGSILTPDADNISWFGLNGYQPGSIQEEGDKKSTSTSSNSKIPIIGMTEVSRDELKDMIDKMCLNFNNEIIKLAAGWVIACVYSFEIHKACSCFPILFIGGRRESGKTTLASWIMSMLGFSEISGDSLSSATEASVNRNLSWFRSLAYWLDEYRNDAKTTSKWEGYFRNAYQRQIISKGTISEKIRTFDINSAVILSGEETPQDNALLSRCLIMPLTKNSRNSSLFNEIEKFRQDKKFSRMLVEAIRLKSKLLPDIMTDIQGFKERLLKEKVGERTALNFAIPAACYFNMFMKDSDHNECSAFLKWLTETAQSTEKEKENEHMLAIFMEDIVSLQEQLKGFYRVLSCPNETKGKRRVAIHFRTFYSFWTDFYRRKGNQQFKANAMLNYILEEPYYIAHNVNTRIGPENKATRCLVLSLDDEDGCPPGLKTLADNAPVQTQAAPTPAGNLIAATGELPF